MAALFTEKQGQYLAFIYAYTKLHRRPPAEADMQNFFEVTPPSVHRMVVELELCGLIRRQPGQARSIQLLVEPEALDASVGEACFVESGGEGAILFKDGSRHRGARRHTGAVCKVASWKDASVR